MKTLKTGLVILAVISAFNLTPARADQPFMHEALSHLRQARAALEQGSTDKGGWRLRAIADVDRAIADTERGIEFARTH